MTLEFVCNDVDYSGHLQTWHFDPESKKFVRLNENNNQEKSISGEYLPDPMMLWNKRVELYGQRVGTEVAKDFGGVILDKPIRLKPSPAIFSMWERWQKEVSL